MADVTIGHRRRSPWTVLGFAVSSPVLRALGVVGFFATWEVASIVSDSPVLPPVEDVVSRLWDDIDSGLIWYHARLTLFRAFLGFSVALVVGVALGLWMGRNRIAEAIFEPLLAATYPIPKLALYPVFILLFGFGGESKVLLVALECVYPIAYNVYEGARTMPRSFLWVAQNVEARPLARAGITFRSALPAVLAGVRIALPIMLVVMVVTELLGESRGLGFLIRQASTNFEYDGALAIVLLFGIIGFVLDRLVVWLTRLLVFWQRPQRA